MRLKLLLSIGLVLLTLAALNTAAQETKTKADKPELEIRILFDNTAANKDYLRSWGFSALIDFRGKRILFDSGGDPILLLEHMEKMKIDPMLHDSVILRPRLQWPGADQGPPNAPDRNFS